MQQMWKETLGVDIVLTNTDWKVYLSRENNGDFEISRAGWIGDYQDPKTFLDMMVSGRGNNKTGWSNPEYDSSDQGITGNFTRATLCLSLRS